MIGEMIAKIRKEKGMTKTELSKLTNINIGHLTHIEKGERNPSQKALKNICQALEVPYQQLMCTYGKDLNEDQQKYGLVNYLPYNKVLAVDNINGLITCPPEAPSASIAFRVNDDAMKNSLAKNSYVFVEFNAALNHKDIGVFCLNDEIIIRKFIIKKNGIVLRAENKFYDEITVKDDDDFYIIGKVFV